MLFDKNKFEYKIFLFFVWVVRKIKIKNNRYLAKFLAIVFYYILRLRRKVVIKKTTDIWLNFWLLFSIIY